MHVFNPILTFYFKEFKTLYISKLANLFDFRVIRKMKILFAKRA
jgi:hypothetical protein